MLSKFALFVTSAYTLTAVAAPGGPTSSSCNSGPVQCCNSIQSTENNDGLRNFLGLLGASMGNVATNVGFTCSPVNVIGASGNNCNSQTVCCEDNSFNGLIAIGCNPININL